MKTGIKIVLIILGIALIVNASVLFVIANFNAGVILTFLLGLFFLLYGIFFRKINDWTKRGFGKFLKIAVMCGLAFFLCTVAFLAVIGQSDTAEFNEDALIILGAGVRGDTPTLTLAYRLDKGVEYHKKNPEAVIIVSGGQGLQETVTEASAMEKYLIEKGVPKEKIIKEERATSTSENFRFSKEILDEIFGQDYRCAFISNDFHMYRAQQLARIAGLDAARYHAKIEWYTTALNYSREFLTVIKLLIFKN